MLLGKSPGRSKHRSPIKKMPQLNYRPLVAHSINGHSSRNDALCKSKQKAPVYMSGLRKHDLLYKIGSAIPPPYASKELWICNAECCGANLQSIRHTNPTPPRAPESFMSKPTKRWLNANGWMKTGHGGELINKRGDTAHELTICTNPTPTSPRAKKVRTRKWWIRPEDIDIAPNCAPEKGGPFGEETLPVVLLDISDVDALVEQGARALHRESYPNGSWGNVPEYSQKEFRKHAAALWRDFGITKGRGK